MPDIAMCASADCPLRRNCYRHAASGTAPTPGRQSYADWKWRFTRDDLSAHSGHAIQCAGFDFTPDTR